MNLWPQWKSSIWMIIVFQWYLCDTCVFGNFGRKISVLSTIFSCAFWKKKVVIWALFLLKDNWPFCKILCNLVWILEKYIEKMQGFFKFIKTQVRCHLSSRNQLKIWEIHANTIRPSSSPNKHWGYSGFTNTRLNVSVSLFLDAWMKHGTIFLHYLESDMVFQLHCAANLRLK